jgi:hypothetical protein
MLTRGRKTAANLVAIPLNRDRRRLHPPPHLTDRERRLFAEIVGSCPPGQFVASDVLLLESFVKATLLARGAAKKAASDPRSLQVWEKATRTQTTLATRLRLTVQARADPRTLGRKMPQRPLSYYEEMELEGNKDADH